jgi:omega-amidase
MKIHLVQFAIDNLRPETNRARAAELVRASASLGKGREDLIMLPELFSTGTLPPEFDPAGAEAIARADRDFLTALARETGAHVLAGILGTPSGGRLTEESGKPLNLAVLFDPDGAEILSYGKIHPFSLGGEDEIFLGGDSIPLASVSGFTVQAAVCYDLRFPELFRAGAAGKSGRGLDHPDPHPDLYVIPANWPQSRQEHWDVLLRARAIENQAFVAGVNCVGTQRGTVYAGGSKVVSPKGEVLVDAGTQEGVVSAEISADHVRAWRRVFPALRDRRSDGFWSGNL